MNALQKLIVDYLADNPGENYSTIARRGELPRTTVHSLATTESRKQTPQPETIERLAKGMGMSVPRVRMAAADAAGYRPDVPQEMDTQEGRLIVAAWHGINDERKRDLARRARLLLAEQQESDSDEG
jgi:hypothetical protein